MMGYRQSTTRARAFMELRVLSCSQVLISWGWPAASEAAAPAPAVPSSAAGGGGDDPRAAAGVDLWTDATARVLQQSEAPGGIGPVVIIGGTDDGWFRCDRFGGGELPFSDDDCVDRGDGDDSDESDVGDGDELGSVAERRRPGERDVGDGRELGPWEARPSTRDGVPLPSFFGVGDAAVEWRRRRRRRRSEEPSCRERVSY